MIGQVVKHRSLTTGIDASEGELPEARLAQGLFPCLCTGGCVSPGAIVKHSCNIRGSGIPSNPAVRYGKRADAELHLSLMFEASSCASLCTTM